jgi:hypothetical protein
MPREDTSSNKCVSETATDFSVPRDGEIFISSVYERCEDLINHDIWSGIDLLELQSWWSNFRTPEEKYFAACILDSLIYRSKKQTIALIQHLFLCTIPRLANMNPMPIHQELNWIKLLQNTEYDPQVRLVTAIKQKDPPTKSAFYVARMMKQDLSICELCIVKPWEIKDCIKNQNVNVFIFIDDFLGSGDQFSEILEEEQIVPLLNSHYIAYIPLVAHNKGIQDLKDKFPGLRVTSVELLNNSNGLFNMESCCFDDETNNPESARTFYYKLLKDKGIRLQESKRCGYGRLGLAYAFEHATPDNCLPILWWNKSTMFKPLFKR